MSNVWKRDFYHEMENIFKERSISRVAFHSCNLNGRHCRQLCRHSDYIFRKIKELVITKDFSKKYEQNPSNKSEIITKDRTPEEINVIKSSLENMIDLTRDAIQYLGVAMSIINRFTPPTINDEEIVKIATIEFMICWRALGLSVTPKAHYIDCHLYDDLVEYGAHGIHSEESVECFHAIYNRLARLYSSMRDKFALDKLIRKKLHRNGNQGFQLVWSKIVENTAHKKTSREAKRVSFAAKFIPLINQMLERDLEENITPGTDGNQQINTGMDMESEGSNVSNNNGNTDSIRTNEKRNRDSTNTDTHTSNKRTK